MLGRPAAHALEGGSAVLTRAQAGPSQQALGRDGAAGFCTADCLRDGE